MRSTWVRIAALTVGATLVACCGGASSAGDGDGGATDASGDPPTSQSVRTCLDPNGAAVAPCPITVAGTVCARGDANACLAVTREEVATGGSMGPCLHLVIRNDCGAETYAQTCIEHREATGLTWQCWTSSTLPAFSIEVAQCNATGRYFRYGSTSAGTLTILNSQCARPM